MEADYNKIKSIATIARQRLVEYVEPHNQCFGASFALCLQLSSYRPKLVFGYAANKCHYWVEVNDFILDITADQFNDEYRDEPRYNFPEIMLEPKSECKTHCQMRIENFDWLIMCNWEQHVSSEEDAKTIEVILGALKCV